MNNKTNGAYNGDNEVLYLSLMQHTAYWHITQNILLTLILTQKN